MTVRLAHHAAVALKHRSRDRAKVGTFVAYTALASIIPLIVVALMDAVARLLPQADIFLGF